MKPIPFLAADPSDQTNTSQVVSFLSVLSSLTVRNEYCKFVADGGQENGASEGLKGLLRLLAEPDQNREVVGATLRLLKTLAGNDDVKRDIGKLEGISVIVNAMGKHSSSKPVSHFGCGCLGAVCLRNTDNAKAVVKDGGAVVLIQVLKVHTDPKVLVRMDKCVLGPMLARFLQTSCCQAIRNVVSRARELSAAFISAGGEGEDSLEALLGKARVSPKCADSAKAALRDLGLKVDLNEEWTGAAIKSPVQQ